MALTYTVKIQETEPNAPANGWFWIKPSTGQCNLSVGGEWYSIAVGNPFSSLDQSLFLTLAFQGTEPSSPDIGQIWIHNLTYQAFIYIDDFVPYLGG